MSLDAGVLDGAIPPAENTRLFGHENALAFLAGAYRTGQLHHALLFEGPQGIGKATLAYRLTYHILTHPDPESAPAAVSDPDLNTPLLRQLASGASHNLLHLARPVDTKTGRIKSAITVDEVRRAGHFLSQTSGTGNWRIVIIDPADDMNRSRRQCDPQDPGRAAQKDGVFCSVPRSGKIAADDPLALHAVAAETVER